MQSKLFQVAGISFFGFILWVIYLANTGGSSIFFELIREIPHGDKLGHFGLFGVLTLLFNIACGFKAFRLFSYSRSRLRVTKVYCYWATCFVFIFAVAEELSQGWLDTRTLDWQDLLADLPGIACFTLLSYRVSKHKPVSKQPI